MLRSREQDEVVWSGAFSAEGQGNLVDDDTVIVEKLKQTIEQRDAEPETAAEPEKAEEEKEAAPKLNVTRHE